jgi:alkanesulfonate monooxygenase SsuD/methylene tetrahydromethanopterin reductase-like flavin-dependent oxidoreductase (luciferase family)
MPQLEVVIGETESIAQEKAAFLNSLIDPELAMATTSAMLGADISKAKTEEEFVAARGEQGHGGIEDRHRQVAKNEGISFVEAVRKPRPMVVGTPAMIADHMQAMFDAGGCDGFVLTGNVTPGMFEDFGRMVVPELQRRGLYRTEYTGATMRENLLT